MDILPTITHSRAEVFIKSVNDKGLSWTVFLDPFSGNIWLSVMLIAMVILFLLTFMEIFFDLTNDKSWFVAYLRNLLISMKGNIDGKPSSVEERESYRIVLFVFLFIGAVVGMAYLASITSKLTVTKLKLPFDDLESLYQSNFK